MGIQIAAIALGYLIGTIPTAYLLLRWKTGRDIRHEGSGNVGAMNAYEVTGVKWIGVVTGVLDALKGALAVGVGILIGGAEFLPAALAAFFVVLGHNYNLFLGFRGGRGLAPAAGAMALINPVPILLFCLMWLTGYYVIRRNVHIANFTAALGTSILIFNTPTMLLYMFAVVSPSDILQLKLLVLMLCIQMVVRHVEPLRMLLVEAKNSDKQ